MICDIIQSLKQLIMGTRKNARFLSATEKENFVKACVMMKADIVNPGDPADSQYSKWDEFVAIHWMIQNAFTPGSASVNFGHGGSGSYSFLSWHRYFLYQFEQQIQSYVPGVMLPYWDWADPSPIMTDTFLGPNGNAGNNNIIEQGYFAFDRPGAGVNATVLPAWWPPALLGWRIPAMFPSDTRGGLRRQTGLVGNLPTVADLQATLNQPDYPSFQYAAEAGTRMHNSLHGWIGGGSFVLDNFGHMSDPQVSPADPIFYLHHCNIDRLWAMWQADGHENEYPAVGGDAEHNRNDIMYPWTGGTAGYGTNEGISSSIPMPDFSGLGVKRNVDTLDFRNAFNYTYDTIPIIGIGLDRTGSMNGLTPDPMVSTDPDVTKWEAAKRGVSAFLQDCETVQDSKTVYVIGGIKTFRTLFPGGNDFTTIFGAPGYGLIKAGGSFSKSTFDSNIAPMTAAGGTPLADALIDVQNTIVQPPFGGVPSDEQRYLAMLTDGMLTTGSPMNSIPDGSMSPTAIFGMGFGTGAEVDYATIASIVAKGTNLSTDQVFHGEDAGTIDKFFTNSLAAAIGFTSVFDPVIELFDGEYTHLSFSATSADDCFLLTAQGMDFKDKNWKYVLHAPNGQVVYGDHTDSSHSNGCNHCCPMPHITAVRSNGRLSMVIQRNNADKTCWVGSWVLMVFYKTRIEDAMYMLKLGEILFPSGAGPIKGERYARLLSKPGQRIPTRNVAYKPLHGLDFRGAGTNNSNREACDVVVNVYARSNIKLHFDTSHLLFKIGEEIKLNLLSSTSLGTVRLKGGFARLISPAIDIHDIISKEEVAKLVKLAERSKKYNPRADVALALGRYEKKAKDLLFIKDAEVKVVQHDNSPVHIHHGDSSKPGVYHLGVAVDGIYYPDAEQKNDHDQPHHHKSGGGHESMKGDFEVFTRLLNISFGVE